MKIGMIPSSVEFPLPIHYFKLYPILYTTESPYCWTLGNIKLHFYTEKLFLGEAITF